MKLKMVSGHPKYQDQTFTESFIKIQCKEACQDYTYHQSLFLESWRTGRLLMKIKMVSGHPKYQDQNFTESFIKIKHRGACQDSTYPPSLFLESWRIGMFLMELELVSRYPKDPKEALLKVSLRSNIGKLVKTTPIINVSSWSLGGH